MTLTATVSRWLGTLFQKAAENTAPAEEQPFAAMVDRALGDPDFTAWIGETKVSADGRPKLQFHSTKMPIDAFWPLTHFGSAQAATERISKSAHYGDAQFQLMPYSQIYPVFLKIENPLSLPDLGMHTKPAYREALETANILTPDELSWVFDADHPLPLQTVVVPGSYDVFPAEDRDRMRALLRTQFNAYEREFHAATAELAAADFFAEDSYHPANIWIQRLCQTLMKKGYDGICYANTQEHKGEDSWIILHPSQVRFALSPHASPAMQDLSARARAEALADDFRTGRVNDTFNLGMGNLRPDVFLKYKKLEPGQS